jgi:pSer/pThr/pTyr-binding forkhead associated (FHA) protein/outer membrane protein assembly factor BamD (BamD/ComL family)
MSFDDFDDDLDDDELKDHEKKQNKTTDNDEDAPEVNEDIDLNSLDLTEYADSEDELSESPAELELDEIGADQENSEIDLSSLDMTEQASGEFPPEAKDNTKTDTVTSFVRRKTRDAGDVDSEDEEESGDEDEKTSKKLSEKYKTKAVNKEKASLYTKSADANYKTRTKFVTSESDLKVAEKSLKVDELKDPTDSEIDDNHAEEETNPPTLAESDSSPDISFKIEGDPSTLNVSSVQTKESNKEGSQQYSDGDATVIASGETFISTTPVKALLTVKAGKLKKQTFTLSEDVTVLGRSIDADITLPDPRASRRHVQIVYSDGQYIVEDLGSANGIKVNGKKLTKHLLNPQDKISIGHTVLEFMLVDPENYDELEDPSKVLDYDPEAQTQMGTQTEQGSSSLTLGESSFQSAGTEVVGDGFVDESVREESDLLIDTPVDSVIIDRELRNNNVSSFEHLMTKIREGASDFRLDKKQIRIMAILLLLFGGLGYLLMSDGGDSSQDVVKESSQNSVAVETSTMTGLTPEQEALAKKHYSRAREYYEQEQYQNAITEAKRAITVYPDFTQAHDIIAYSEEAIEDVQLKEQEAEEKSISEAENAKVEALLNDGDKLLRANKFRQAMDPIKKVLKIDETHEEARAMLKEALTGLNSIKKVAVQRAALRKRMMAKFDEAESVYKTKDYIKAMKAYNSVLVLGRRTSPSIYDRAQNKLKMTRSKVVRGFSPKIEEVKINMTDQNYSKALRTLDGILKLYPGHKKAQRLRAQAYEELSLQVRKIYQQALIMESINDLEESNEGYQKILKMAPKSHKYYKKALRKLKKYN